MTLEELSRGYKLRERLREDEEILESLQAKAHPGAQWLDGMPRSSGVGDKAAWLAIEIADMQTEIETLKSEIDYEKQKAETYIATIRDAKTRTIFRLRFVHCMTWVEVADVMGRYYSAEGCRKCVYTYIRQEERTGISWPPTATHGH